MPEQEEGKLWEERRRYFDEIIGRNTKDIDEISARVSGIEKLSIQIDDMIKCQNALQETYESRISALEKRPGNLWDKLIGGIIGALSGAVAAALLSLILK